MFFVSFKAALLRVHFLEQKVEHGLASLEARNDANMPLSRMDMAAVEGRVTDKVMMKCNDEYKRRMNEEDKHTINNYESLQSLVWQLELGCGGAEGEEREGSAASTAAASTGSGSSGWFNSGTVGNWVQEKMVDLGSDSVGVEGWELEWREAVGHWDG